MLTRLSRDTKIIVQGITGREGSFHTKLMLEYGARIVAGVTPGKGGMKVHGVPVYDTVMEAVEEHPGVEASVIFVPAAAAPDAVYEAVDAGIKLIVVITEHIPVHETLKFVNYAKQHGSIVIGPNCPGIIVPGETKLGIMPHRAFRPGRVALLSRSGTLTYEIAMRLSDAGLGQSIAVGLGGDPIVGLDFVEALEMLRDDARTDAIVLIGEIGGDMEERAAEYIRRTDYPKPVVAYVAGRTAPPGRRMGHAGAIISLGMGDAKSKVEAFERAGVPVAERPSDIPTLVKRAMKGGAR